MKEDDFYNLLGERIASYRKISNVKQEDLATILEISRPSIVNIEKGRQKPSVYMILKIANHFNVDLLELLPSLEERIIPQAIGVDDKMAKSDAVNRFLELIKSENK